MINDQFKLLLTGIDIRSNYAIKDDSTTTPSRLLSTTQRNQATAQS
jgi:hypothetical protein